MGLFDLFKSNQTKLFDAIAKGNLSKVQILLDKGADLNATDEDGRTVLMIAVDSGHIDIIQTLLSKGTDVNARDENGRTFLIEAAASGRTDIVQALLDKGADTEIEDGYGMTALIMAAASGRTDIVQALLDKGADADIKTKPGFAALLVAAANGHADIVQTLLDKGADAEIEDEYGQTALAIAMTEGHSEVVDILKQHNPGAIKKGKEEEKSVAPANSQHAIEDVRSSPNEEGEVILNLWYVTNMFVITSLRAKAYVASGTDDDKLRFLRMRATSDFKDAQVFSVPEDMKANLIIDGVTMGKACMPTNVELSGGYAVLFRDILLGVPTTYSCSEFRFDPDQVMMCITGLTQDKDGVVKARIDGFEQL